MKYRLIKLFAFTALLLIYAQSSIAQTKQESLEWFEEYGKQLVNVPPGNVFSGTKMIEIKKDTLYIYGHVDNMIVDRDDHRVALKDIRYKDISKLIPDEESEGYKKIKIKTRPGKAIWTYQAFVISRSTDSQKDSVDFWYKNEADAIRIWKCIMHLAKLSGAEPIKQTF